MDTLIFALVVFLLITISAVCSGLNISFMSLDIAELERKAKLGNKQAKRVLPLRRNSHLTLAAILLTNVGAASATPLVIGDAFNGIIAGIASTILLVIFGEIFPQALFTRNAMEFCSHFAPAMRAMVFVTYPLSKPLQLLLDRLFGDAKRVLHSRHELGIIISEHLGTNESELDDDEVEIIRGALQLSEKRVRDIMTPMKKVFWLEPHAKLNKKQLLAIKKSGRSRIPIFNKTSTVCYGVLLVKDLLAVDFTERPQRVDELPLHSTKTVGSMTALDTMFRKFIGAHTHLMPIERDNKIIGIVTIEDLLEEIVGHEIEDETDRIISKIARR